MDRSFILLDPSLIFVSRHIKINSRKKNAKVPLGKSGQYSPPIEYPPDFG
jgi:hypothetical protein